MLPAAQALRTRKSARRSRARAWFLLNPLLKANDMFWLNPLDSFCDCYHSLGQTQMPESEVLGDKSHGSDELGMNMWNCRANFLACLWHGKRACLFVFCRSNYCVWVFSWEAQWKPPASVSEGHFSSCGVEIVAVPAKAVTFAAETQLETFKQSTKAVCGACSRNWSVESVTLNEVSNSRLLAAKSRSQPL